MFRNIGRCFLLLSVSAGIATGQIGRGTILGTVTDAQHAVIPGALVVAVQTQTNIIHRATTNDAGLFSFPDIPVGTYDVAVTKEGFKRETRAGVVLEVDANARVDFHLEIGAVAESVEVSGEAPLVNTTNATEGDVIDNRRIGSLPLSGRNALSLVILTPNVRSLASSPEGFADRGLEVTAFSVNGGPVGMNNITIDGATNLNVRAGDTNVNPTVDSIEEFKVQSGTMSAEYGYTAGGVVNIVTKSGTNVFHGTVYDFLRNDALDARNAFATGIAPYRYNQYGGALGGPIKRNRTFFFVNYEGYRYLQYYTAIGTTPTPQERTGDFSQLFGANGQLIPIYDPRTTAANPAGNGFVRTPFPGNAIPKSELDPVALNILQFYPLPNRTPSNLLTQSNNYQANLGSTRSANQELFKIDHHFSEKNSLSGRYMLWDAKNDNASTGAGYFSDPIARVRNDNYVNRNVNLTDTEVFSPNLVDQFQFNIARQYFPFTGASYGQNETAKLGLPSSVPDITVPAISIPEIQSFPAGFAAYAGTNAMQTFQLTNSVTWLKGRHSLKIWAGTAAQPEQFEFVLGMLRAVYFQFDIDGQPASSRRHGLRRSQFSDRRRCEREHTDAGWLVAAEFRSSILRSGRLEDSASSDLESGIEIRLPATALGAARRTFALQPFCHESTEWPSGGNAICRRQFWTERREPRLQGFQSPGRVRVGRVRDGQDCCTGRVRNFLSADIHLCAQLRFAGISEYDDV